MEFDSFLRAYCPAYNTRIAIPYLSAGFPDSRIMLTIEALMMLHIASMDSRLAANRT